MSRPMRILALETIAVEAARRSAYRALGRIEGCEVHLLVPAAWKEQGGISRAEPEPDPLLHLHVSGILLGFRQHRVLFTALRKVLREVQPDVLYADTEPENYLAAQCRLAIAAVSPKTRLALASCRNLDYPSIGFPYKFAFTHGWCDALARRRPADIVFVRPRSALHLLEGYARAVVHLPFPVDCDRFSPDTPESIPAGEGVRTLGFVGRLVKGKGIPHLLHAMAHLPENVHALLVGDGPMHMELAALARDLHIASRVRFLPAVPYAGVPGIIKSMDILVLPSVPTVHWVEQFGRVLIESMACGTPIVASRSGEIPEVLGEGGILVNPGDERDLIRVLDQLLCNPRHCAALGMAGRARAIQKYSAPVVANIMYSAFKACL